VQLRHLAMRLSARQVLKAGTGRTSPLLTVTAVLMTDAKMSI
jgi:hypothetical protein